MLLFLILFLIFSIPAVQTSAGKYATNKLNEAFKTDINIGKVGLQLNGDVELKEILIIDYKKDTLISIGELNTSIISFKNLYNGKLNFGDIDIQNLIFNLKTYKNAKDTNLDVFVEKFDDDNPRVGPSTFLLSSSDVSIGNGIFRLTDENLETPRVFEFTQLNANTTNFLIDGPNVSSRINTFNFKDSRGIIVKNFTTNFKYTLSQMSFENLNIKTNTSELKGNLKFNYKREHLKDFTDKVIIDANFKDSKISLTELNVFFNEFGVNQRALLDTNLSGTLNHLKANNLNVSTTSNTKIIGNITFKNLFTKDRPFALQGDFKKLASNYNDLISLLPNILGNSIPSILSKVGNFKIKGSTNLTTSTIESDLHINTDLGLIESNLKLTKIDDIDNANYKGNVVFEAFNLGELINDPLVKNTSFNLDVEGKGFTVENLDTKINGDVFLLNYNDYDYSNITVLGALGNKIFNGKLDVDDSNLKLKFNGLADLSKKENTFNFTANIKHSNLRALNFITRDHISEFKGFVNMNIKGSTYDNAVGTIKFKNTTYKNQDDNYSFKDFDIVSTITNRKKIININSSDIISGQVSGLFKIKDILKLTENSISSLYTNYVPIDIEKGQYLNFKFNIYSKIATVFFKDLVLGKNTFIKGRIETDENGFDLTFNSPEIKFRDYFANTINIIVDNDNPIYNTYIAIDSLSTGFYNASDFNLINVTKRDTLLVKSEFKGGKNNKDNFALNMYYTIDEDNKSVVGFRKSDITFKTYDWLINPQKNKLNKIKFDRQFKDIEIFPLTINQANEEILVSGTVKNTSSKDIKIDFKNVNLEKITPQIDSLSLKGIVDGTLNIKQTNGVYLPKSNITISQFNVNKYNIGDLKANIKGNNSITNYNVDVSLVNNKGNTLKAKGFIDVAKNNPNINIDIALNEFLIDPLNPLGEGVINNIRGLVSGNAKIIGSLKKPDINGELFLGKAGFSIPYLNVDYGFDSNSKVVLQTQKFIFNNVSLSDSKYNSKGNLNGHIEHHNFSDWRLDLDLQTNKLLVLDTKEAENQLYYGTGFISGNAKIKGLTNALVIDVKNGRTEPGTEFYIPLNDSESFGDNTFIHFLSPKEKASRSKGEASSQITFKGLELKFDLDVNQNALIEIVIDKEAGSTIKGKGEGNLGFFINTNGTFDMWGDFTVYEGIYNFKYGGFVEKKFEVLQGGNIVWNGDPLKAAINLKAVYKTTANPSVLLDNPISQRIPVEVEISLTGELEQPEPDFNLQFPNVTSTVKSELDYRLSSKDERTNQALTLLGTGGFSNGIRGVNFTGTISERLSGIVNNILGDNNENLNIGLDLELGQDTPEIQTNNKVGFTLQTKISDKVLVNGKLGVPFGSASQTVISGDVQIDLLLNEDGTLRAKVFNKENAIRNFGEEIGHTQGAGLSYNVEFNSFKELLQTIFLKKHKKDKKPTSNTQKKDDENLPSYIKMKDKKGKTKS